MYDVVKDYYGKQLQGSADLKTTACCDTSLVPAWLKPLLARIHPEVLNRYYGCGLVCPPLLAGSRILDLGCGSGRDVYVLAQLAGPTDPFRLAEVPAADHAARPRADADGDPPLDR